MWNQKFLLSSPFTHLCVFSPLSATVLVGPLSMLPRPTSRAFALLKPLPFFSSLIYPLPLLWSGWHTLTLAAPGLATGVPFSMDSNCERRSGLACALRDDLTHLRRVEGVSLNRYMHSVVTVPAIGINIDLYMILLRQPGT